VNDVTMTPRVVLAAGSMLDRSAEVLLDAAAQGGFDAVGLRLSGEHGTGALAALARRAADLGIGVHDTEVIRLGSDSVDPQHLIDASVVVGASQILVVSDLASITATIDALGPLVRRCADAGLGVGLEYMAWTTPATVSDALTIARATQCRLVVDVLHHHRIGAGPVDLATIVEADLLAWVQLADAPLSAPENLIHEARHTRLAPGDGELPLATLIAVLPRDTTYSVEVQSDDLATMDARERATYLARSARRALVAGGR
jgi:sugar phosphate isomerase/epimerase